MSKFWLFLKELLEVVAYLLACMYFIAGLVDSATFWVLVAIYFAVSKP